MEKEPFHDGEIQLQSKTGERRTAKRSGQFINEHLTPNGNAFLMAARFANFGLSDADGQVWSFVGSASEPFFTGSDERHAQILRKGLTIPDRFWELAKPGSPIGSVAMDLTRARRLRLNGSVIQRNEEGLIVEVTEICPNCPKYIQQRLPVTPQGYQSISPREGTDLSPDLHDMIQESDTFFVASRHANTGHDASHRGGNTGFVKVEGNRLLIPDYTGNSMFMTLGNFSLDPAAGLTFVDFERGSQLNLTGTVKINLDDPSPNNGKTGRYWTFDVLSWALSPFRPDPAWKLNATSRFNPVHSG